MKEIIKILTEEQKQIQRRKNCYETRIHILKRFLKLQYSTSYDQYSYEYRTIKYLKEKLRKHYGTLNELIFIIMAYLRNNHPLKYSSIHTSFHYEETIKQLENK